MRDMLTSVVGSIYYIRKIATPLHVYMSSDVDYMRTDSDRRRIDENYLKFRTEFFNTLNPVQQIQMVQGGAFISNYNFSSDNDELTDIQKLEIYMNSKRDGKVNAVVFDLLLGRARQSTETDI